MKKIFLSFAVLAMGMAMFTSCSNDDDENVKILGFEGDQWAALIDEPQYGGELLYGDGGTTPEQMCFEATDGNKLRFYCIQANSFTIQNDQEKLRAIVYSSVYDYTSDRSHP